MKIKFICLTSYTIGNRTFNYGDELEDESGLLKQFPYLFEEMKPKRVVNYPLDDMTVADLQKFAKQHSIVIDKTWKKKQLIDNIKKAINE